MNFKLPKVFGKKKHARNSRSETRTYLKVDSNNKISTPYEFSKTPKEGYSENQSSHLIADNNKRTAWPTITEDNNGGYVEQSRKQARKAGEVYKFATKKKTREFAREGNWKKPTDKKKKGYKRLYKEESGETDEGKLTVYGIYRPSRNVGKSIEKDITYKTADSPRKKVTERTVTKKYKDGSTKSYKNIIRVNNKKIDVPNISSPKEKYKKGEKPFK